jgi:hypothetical protein
MCNPFGATTLGNFISLSPPTSSHLQFNNKYHMSETLHGINIFDFQNRQTDIFLKALKILA